MSGHNPHSHLSQPNSSWNPLQIPSYIPRQPQLAHMSNERPLVRSPLTWHSPAPPTPPEAFYSFLSNHKNLELNPLLPSFVRGPPPFGSVDLTIQSARNSTTSSPRNLASPPPSQEYPGHNKPPQTQQQQPYPPQHHSQHPQHQQIPRSLTPNNHNSASIPPLPGQGVIQSTGSVRDKFQCGSSNSNNGEIVQAQLPPTAGNIFIRDARQINNEIAKMAARDPTALEASMLPLNEPVELIKESPYQLTKSHTAVPMSPKRLSPTRPPSIPNCTPMSPRSRSPLATFINTGSATDLVNNHNLKATGNGINLQASQKLEATVTSALPSENSPLSLALPPSPTTTASNEDSVDSQTSKSRRKRKPNKTTRVSNDSDESMHDRGENEPMLVKSAVMVHEQQTQMNLVPDRSETLIDLDSKKLISSNTNETAEVIDSNNTACQSDNLKQDDSKDSTSNTIKEVHDSDSSKFIEPTEPYELTVNQNKDVTNGESLSIEVEKRCEEEPQSLRPPSPPEESPSVIVNNTSLNAVHRNESNSPVQPNHSNAKILNSCQGPESPPTSLETNQENLIEPATTITEPILTPESPVQESAPTEEHLDSPQKRCKRKGDSDDIETIDKIAAMIAGTHSNEDEANESLLQNEDNEDNLALLSKEVEEKEKDYLESSEKEAQLDEIQPTNNNSKISDLAELLETPPEGTSPSKDLVEDCTIPDGEKPQPKENVENCFEEVENKLEEMFAGIEDGDPPPCILAPPTIDEPITPEVISELGLGGISSPLKQPPPPPSTSASSEDMDHVKSSQSTDDTSTKSSNHHNSNQKRPHNSNKSDSTPPSKKKKLSKKSNQSSSSSSNQKSATTSTSTSSKSSKQHSSSGSSHANKSSKSNEKHPSTSAKEKVKEEPITVEYKGPFIQVKSDGTINVINAPTTEDVVEKQNKVKKSIHNHSNSDRSKIRGLHVSTLSTKYDADTTDTSWMCVFCKKGPHKIGLGDLFGPYIITTTCDGFVYSQKDPKDDDFISKRTKGNMVQKQVNGMPVVPASTSSFAQAMAALNACSSNSSTSKKKRKTNDSPSLQNSTSSSSPLPLCNFDLNEIYVGMTKVSETSYEVWVHENCVVWASGVYIIGARIVDLDTAVWSSTRYKCSICSKNGAMISCLQRGCEEKAHIPCARTGNWILDENEFRSMCTKHSTALLPSS